jgi:DNA/RNA-binding domain of Phe-tRNA-synthetase-like protein
VRHWRDDAGVTRRWNWRQARRTRLTEGTAATASPTETAKGT